MMSFAVLLLCALTGHTVRLNETTNTTHSCLACRAQMEETIQKNIERFENDQSNLLTRMRNVENLLETLREDVNYVLNRQDATLKVNVQNNTNDIGQLKQELSRFQTICSPPCENGGQCVKNVCNCTPSFTGDRCQQPVCSPPCENEGECMENNICNCMPFFNGDRCQDVTCIPPCENGGQCMTNNACHCTPYFTGDRCQQDQCGVEFNNGGNNGGGNNTSSDLVWPWMAAVYRTDSYTEHVCDGSVIHRHFVLTSARCVTHYGSDQLSVKLGLGDLKKGTHLQEYRVRSFHRHPQYKGGPGQYNNLDYDIALLQLEEPIAFDGFVRPVCLPPREISQDEPFYESQSTSNAVYLYSYLRQTSSSQIASLNVLNLTILPQEECRRKMKEQNWEDFFPSPDLSFCAESPSSTCIQWGSPLLQSRLAGTRKWTQVGITSRCGGKLTSSPRLDHLIAWVEATIAATYNQTNCSAPSTGPVNGPKL